MEIVNTCYRRNPIKETCPDACPKANKLPIIVEHVNRDSGGSHSTLMPFSIIHWPCWMKMSGFLWVNPGLWFSSRDGTLRVPKLVIKYEPSRANSRETIKPLTLRVCWSTPVAVSQSCTALPQELDANRRPSGEKATE